eukprot:906839-Pyramimonas_sp.AAC.1
MGTATDSRCAAGVAADGVHLRQEAACQTAVVVGSGQHLLLGIVPILSVLMSGVQEDRRMDGSGSM